MLSPDDPISRVIAVAIVVALGALITVRAASKSRREYGLLRRFRSTVRRQRLMRRWLLESLILMGGSSAVLLVIVRPPVDDLLAAAQSVGWIAVARDALASPLGVAGLAVVLVLSVVLTIVGLRSARREGGVVMVGDIAALLPRNRPELGYGAALSLNAGVVEELLFRLALPALLFVATGDPLSAFGIAVLIFAALHVYQGWAGVAGTLLIGLVLTAAYVLSGSILLAIALHAIIDLRTLVLVPMAVYDVHRVPGSRRFPPVLRPLRFEDARPDVEPDAAGPDESASSETDTPTPND